MWKVRYATVEDQVKWFKLATKLTEDFCGLDLGSDSKYRAGMIKNMKRGTAICVEDPNEISKPIVGALTYSPTQNHLSWLGVDPKYRRQGIATALINQMFLDLQDAKEIRVKTFLNDDKYGTAARSFYKKNGFMPGDIEKDNENFPHPVQEFIRNNGS